MIKTSRLLLHPWYDKDFELFAEMNNISVQSLQSIYKHLLTSINKINNHL